jgi:hypothetical protein
METFTLSCGCRISISEKDEVFSFDRAYFVGWSDECVCSIIEHKPAISEITGRYACYEQSNMFRLI